MTVNGERSTMNGTGRLLTVLALTTLAAPAHAQTIVITGGTVFPVSGPRIPNGTVVIQNGRIAAVGANLAVPAGATRIDATGKWVTPGLFHANTRVGLGVAGLGAFAEGGVTGEVNPSFSPLEGLDPGAFAIPVTRTGGVTGGLLIPSGAFLPGQAVAVDLAGERVEQMVVRRGAALILNLTGGSREAGGGSRAGVMARVRRLFDDALEYGRRKADHDRGAIQPLAAPARELEALLPALRGEQLVAIAADRRMDIENALRLVREYRLRAVLASAAEAWQIASTIAQAGVPVVLEPLRDIPSFDGLGARLDNATLLRAAGVRVIIAQGDPGGERTLRYAAGNAVRMGMSWDDALAAITAEPARAFALDDYGTLEAGKVANLVVWSGDPFEFSSAAERVFVRGVETPLRTRETELLERYRRLPP
jgi:imidazolonepropionase-like amidohydrolase